MNILYLCDEYPPGRHGGIGTAVQLLAREMVRQGHKVVVAGFYDWGYGGDDHFLDEGVAVYRFRRKLSTVFLKKQDKFIVRGAYKALSLSGVFHADIVQSLKKYKVFLEQIISRHAIDLIEMPDYLDYLRYAKRDIAFPNLSVPIIVKLHGPLSYVYQNSDRAIPQYVLQTEKQLLQQASSVISVSKYMADTVTTLHDYKSDIQVIHNGIDTSNNIKEEKTKNSVVYTGALSKLKGIYALIQAWNIVNEQIPDATLKIYGKGPVSEISSGLTNAAREKVSFEGHVPRTILFKALAKASLAVFPSYAECFALAPMEAMSVGTAVIYTKTTSGPELIQDGVNGVLINPAKPEEIAEKITLLLQDSITRNKIAIAGRQHVIDNFDISHIAQKHTEYYKTILNRT